jgi:predicted permease
MEGLRRDLRHSLRALRRAPLFTTVAVVTLALGIGVGTTIFSFVDAALLRPLPVDRPAELISVFTSWEGEPHATSSRPDFLDLRQGVTSAELFGHATALATLQHGGRSRMLVGELVTGNAFAVLGLAPAVGRLLTPADDAGPGSPRTLVVGHAFWRRQLGGDARIVGRTLRLDGYTYEVVGVAPASFHGLMPGLVADFWVPSVRVDEVAAAGQIISVAGDPGATLRERRGYRWMWIKGRLAAAGNVAQARTQAAAVMARLAGDFPLTNEARRAVVASAGDVRLHPDLDRVLGAASVVLLGSVALLILVVSANLANMVLSRALSRQREVAIRLALGSSRLRLVRQLFTESLVISLAGAGLGLLLARWTTALLLRALPPLPFEIGLDVGVDGRVALFAVGLGVAAAVLCGLLPARQSLRRDVVAELREGARSSAGRGEAWSLRNVLVVAQVAVSMVLLVAATLLGRGLLAAGDVDVGLEPERIAAVGVNLSLHGYTPERAATFLRQLREQAAALPGVEAAAIGTRVPFDVNLHYTDLYPDAAGIPPGKPGIATDMTAVEPTYFATLGVPLLRGRNFDGRDVAAAPPVAVVNDAMARRDWGSAEAALGRSFRVGKADAPAVTVVGVVADHKVRSVGEAPRPYVHFPLAQRPANNGYLLVRARAADAAPLVERLRRLALALDPEVAVTETTTLAGFMAVSLYPVRMGATLLGAFGCLALGLASVGLYGVIAYSVARRRREMGIRLAVGADPGALLRLVVGQGMKLVGAGVLVGGAVALAATRLLGGVLHGVSALDPLAFAAAAAVLALAGWAANAVPAARAARTHAAVVLRGE